jgi:hypothetical protein
MCLLCVEYAKGKMTVYEGLRNVQEMSEKDHIRKKFLTFFWKICII